MDFSDTPNSVKVSTMDSAMKSLESVYNQVLSEGHDGEDKTRVAMIAKARDLIAALETPLESIIWMAWAEPTRFVAIRIAINLGLFEHLSEDGGSSKTKEQLATKAGVNSNLIGRVLKHLASMRVIEEVAADFYKATPLSEALTIPKYRDAIPFCSAAAVPIFQKLPAFLARTNYDEPANNGADLFRFGHDTTVKSTVWLKERPYILETFSNHMAGYYQGRPSWMDPGFYPVKERILKGMAGEEHAVAIVDVGGGMGYDIVELKKKHPDLPGRFILQDLPQVVEQIVQPLEGIEVTTHNFCYTKQPVTGSLPRVPLPPPYTYPFLQALVCILWKKVLHDWSNEDCRRILKYIVEAMKPGYSKLLINEIVVSDVGASWQNTSLDWFMMALAESRARTEAQWRELLQSVGLKVEEIWTKYSAAESLIEASLVED